MIDPNALVRKWLATSLPTTRITVAVLPEYDPQIGAGFRPEDGPWIVIGVAGGGEHAEVPVFQGRIQISVFAGRDEGLAAGTLSGQIRDLIHGKNHVDLSPDGFVMASYEDSDSQISADPSTGWAMAVSFYQMILRGN